jgi:hypothetical protein
MSRGYIKRFFKQMQQKYFHPISGKYKYSLASSVLAGSGSFLLGDVFFLTVTGKEIWGDQIAKILLEFQI